MINFKSWPAKSRARRMFNEDQIRQIRTMIRDGVKHKEIAEKFGCHISAVSQIKKGTTYFGFGLLEDDDAGDT